MKKILALLLAVLLFAGVLSACNGNAGSDGGLKKGTIEKNGGDEDDESAWRAMTPTARAELDEIYQQKLAATKAFAVVPAASGKTYYISSINGNDANNGTSPETAWASPKKANAVKSGDLVLFECGSEFRRDNELFFTLQSGVTYATYGSGEKPIFYGSIDASDPNLWLPVKGKTNLYYFKTQIVFSGETDIGSIVFNDGEAWGIKIQKLYKQTKKEGQRSNNTLALTDVSNGLKTFASIPSYELKNGSDLKGPDLCFYHDTKYVYLYCEGGNPATRFSSVELSQHKFAFNGEGVSNVTVLNLDFRNFGNHAAHVFNCKNFTIKNCSFTFIGGTVDLNYGDWRNYDTRLGNAVENWNSCDGMTIENCFFDQIYDTAMTTQSNSDISSKNIVYRNNVVQNVWFGVELWAGAEGSDQTIEFSNVDVSGNYFAKIGEGFTTQRPDKIDPGTDYSVNAFIKVSRGPYEMGNSFYVTDNIIDGTNGKMIFCGYPKTKTGADGVVFDRNTYFGITSVDYGRVMGKTYPYTSGGIAAIHALGMETNSTFYYSTSAGQSFDYARMVESMPSYTYKAANGVNLPFRIFFPAGYTEGASYPLVTYLNTELASGTDNMQNVLVAKEVISELIEKNQAIVLVPQCPRGTWTGIEVSNGNYSTTTIAETEVMKAVSAMIRDVADEYHTGKKYAIGADAGAYAVSDLLVRHKDQLTAAVLISGAGDPSASIGNAKVMIVHAEDDEIVSSENADTLAKAWNAKYVFYDSATYWLQHDCWDYVAENEDLLGWLLTK
ncbi:MAG: hypothetical protein E7680_00145 [Ruminococcaceae bacterium]|nr:hypothetical protein [Oscillospiraceae bacterium]